MNNDKSCCDYCERNPNKKCPQSRRTLISDNVYESDEGIFSMESEAIVNPVDCMGAMDDSIALRFKRIFPLNYLAYKEHCVNPGMRLGEVFIFKEDGKYIINLSTKIHWKNKSILKFLEPGFRNMCEKMVDMNIRSVAVPAIGCGRDGLDYSDVRLILINIANDYRGIKFILLNP